MTILKKFDATIKTVTKDTGEFEAILSMPTVDRDGEIIDKGAFLPLPERIPIDIDHGMSVTSTVGSGVPFYDGDTLMFRGSFASTPLGQEVRTLVTEGHIGKMSVAYMGSKYETDEKDGIPHLRSAELLNAAIVAIPSNREAAILSAKAAEVARSGATDITVTLDGAELARSVTQQARRGGNVKVGARNSTKDQERIQAMHDHACELGAQCAAKSAAAEEAAADDSTDPNEKAAAPAAADRSAEVATARATAIAAEAAMALLG